MVCSLKKSTLSKWANMFEKFAFRISVSKCLSSMFSFMLNDRHPPFVAEGHRYLTKPQWIPRSHSTTLFESLSQASRRYLKLVNFI